MPSLLDNPDATRNMQEIGEADPASGSRAVREKMGASNKRWHRDLLQVFHGSGQQGSEHACQWSLEPRRNERLQMGARIAPRTRLGRVASAATTPWCGCGIRVKTPAPNPMTGTPITGGGRSERGRMRGQSCGVPVIFPFRQATIQRNAIAIGVMRKLLLAGLTILAATIILSGTRLFTTLVKIPDRRAERYTYDVGHTVPDGMLVAPAVWTVSCDSVVPSAQVTRAAQSRAHCRLSPTLNIFSASSGTSRLRGGRPSASHSRVARVLRGTDLCYECFGWGK